MKFKLGNFFASGILSLVFLSARAAADAPPAAAAEPRFCRETLLFDNDWSFALGRVDDLEAGGAAGGYLRKAGEGFRPKNLKRAGSPVRLPHDWAVALPPNPQAYKKDAYAPLGPQFPDTSIGWYWRSFSLPASDAGRRIAVVFDGVFRNAMVWVNGHYLGTHEPGYEGFRYDLTDVVEPGKLNDIVVRVDATLHEGWWYEGAGIYRDVWLTKTDPVAVAPNGVFVHADFPGNNPTETPTVNLLVRVQNFLPLPQVATVINEIQDRQGKIVGTSTGTATILPGEDAEIKAGTSVTAPQLWSVDSPTLYTLVTRVYSGNRMTDEVRTPFAFRTIAFDPARGFLLNGRRVMLQGVCLHHDFPGVGTAMTPGLQEYRLQVLRSYGANAIRMSHNPPEPALLDLCDRLGFLVMDEVRAFGGTDYATRQLQSMVLRDRNHPSIILWSIGNEEPVQNTPAGRRLGKTAADCVHRLDPTRPVTHANDHSDVAEGVNAVVDVHGWNYGSIDHGWIPYHQKCSEAPTVITELNANNPTYGDPTKREIRIPYNRISFWNKVVANPWISGVFFWTGFDYAGEVVGKQVFPHRHSDFGIVDRCGFRKEIAWRWQALWCAAPLVHLPEVWDGQPGAVIQVPVVANTEEVELFLNGHSLGRISASTNTVGETFNFSVPYAPGVLEAKGYCGGVVAAADRVETAGPIAGLRLEAPRSAVPARWNETLLVNAFPVDAQGRRVLAGSPVIAFAVEGPVKWIGVGNGDSAGTVPELAHAIPAYQGHAQAVLTATPVPGTVRVTARIEGLPEQSLTLTSLPCAAVPEVPAAP